MKRVIAPCSSQSQLGLTKFARFGFRRASSKVAALCARARATRSGGRIKVTRERGPAMPAAALGLGETNRMHDRSEIESAPRVGPAPSALLHTAALPGWRARLSGRRNQLAGPVASQRDAKATRLRDSRARTSRVQAKRAPARACALRSAKTHPPRGARRALPGAGPRQQRHAPP